jgi:hypothetical protein
LCGKTQIDGHLGGPGKSTCDEVEHPQGAGQAQCPCPTTSPAFSLYTVPQ